MKKVLYWVLGGFVALIVLGAFFGEDVEKVDPTSESKATAESNTDGLDDILGKGKEDTVDLSKKYKKEVKEYSKLKDRKLAYLFDSVSTIASSQAQKIAVGFAAENGISEDYHDGFYRCLGDMTRSKSKDLEIAKVLGWCLTQYEQDAEKFLKEQSKYSYFDLRKDFSDWDGSHNSSVAAIKASMSNPDSFKHQKTLTRFADEEDGFFMYVQTTFTGENQFGGRVTNVVLAKINPRTGEVVSMEMQN